MEDTISILRGLKESYEVFHGVKIHDRALIAAATLSNRYISDRFLPDKAIDLVDEACAMIKTEMESMPQELDDRRRRIMQLEIEEQALTKETDNLSRDHLAKIREELAGLRAEFDAMKAKLDNEKASIERVRALRAEIEKTNADIERAQNEYDLGKAAELKYGKLPSLQKELEGLEETVRKNDGDTLLRDEVTDDEIARIVARWTGIPVSKIMESEKKKLLGLEDVLHRRVIGQDEAVRKVSEAVLRSRAGIQDPNRPHRLVPLLRPHRRRQDRACKSSCRGAVRRRAEPCPYRHERIYGEIHRSRALSARLRDTWATMRADSLPRQCAASPTPWCCSMRSKKLIPTFSTSCFRCLTTAGSQTAAAERWISKTPSSSSPPTSAPT